ncbi:hypothetical protein [Flavobacterium sp. IMCC34518]|uniref:hypothetical protein n=1 Tax=Flavobacterium sp. IMCC34518 TaxID=3003623 RepID=UPI002482ED24|nr:hypothetical protein [Flavobacterium sp. IMCC34518]
MSQEIENQEYHFIINLFDFTTTFLIAPDYDVYIHSLEVLKKREDVASFFVIKGEQIYNSNSD